MKKQTFAYVAVLAGVALIGMGVFLLNRIAEPQGVMLALPYVCIGIGCGIFGHGMGNVIYRRAVKTSPELQRQIRRDQKDERNVAIANRAKSKAYDMMIYVFGALMVSFALMGVDVIAVLLLVFAYLFVIGYGVYYRCKYDREM